MKKILGQSDLDCRGFNFYLRARSTLLVAGDLGFAGVDLEFGLGLCFGDGDLGLCFGDWSFNWVRLGEERECVRTTAESGDDRSLAEITEDANDADADVSSAATAAASTGKLNCASSNRLCTPTASAAKVSQFLNSCTCLLLRGCRTLSLERNASCKRNANQMPDARLFANLVSQKVRSSKSSAFPRSIALYAVG